MRVLPTVFLIVPLMSADPVPRKNLATVCVYKSFLLKAATTPPNLGPGFNLQLEQE